MELLEIVIIKLWDFLNQPFILLGYEVSFFGIFIVSSLLGLVGYFFYKLSE